MIEHLRPGASAANARVALFDFDGTISVIRSGWMEIMIPMMVEILMDLKTGEREEDLRAIVEEFVGRLTGKQTMYQMIALAEEIEKRGGTPLDPLEYKNQYLALLNDRIRDALSELREERCPPEKYLVPGARALLESLRERGLKMYLASGTDHVYMREEARLLDVERYFDGGVFGALDDYKSFSKQMIIERILHENNLEGEQLLGFGDGFVEIEEVKKAGGVAVAVASDEVRREGVNAWKRNRLVQAGADLVIADYRQAEKLLCWLFNE